MKKRVVTSVVYMAILLTCLVLKWAFPKYGSLGFDAVFWFVSVMGAYEFMRAVGDISKAQWWTVMVTCSLIAPSFVITKLALGSNEALVMFMGVASIGMMIVSSLMVFDFTHSNLRSTALSELCILYCGILGGTCVNVNRMWLNSFVAIVFMFAVTILVDTFAFLFGSTLGKKFPQKLAPHTSPNKTIVGGIGAVIGGLVAAVITYVICEFIPVSPFEHNASSLFVYTGRTPKLISLIIISVPTSIIAVLGDLFESAIKRHCGVKDMGNILPGHGGILDRFDSMLYTSVSIVVSFMIINFF